MIYLGTDHAGFELKEYLKEYLKSLNYEVVDMGAKTYVADDDYPDYIIPVAKEVGKDKKSIGIIFGASGQGEAIVANSIRHVRAIVYYGGPLKIVKLSKEHNNTNVLSFGASFVSKRKAKAALILWLDTKFSEDERHIRRLAKEDAI